MTPGLYSFRAQGLDGVDWPVGGVAVLQNGMILGGGPHTYFTGSYSSEAGIFKAELGNSNRFEDAGQLLEAIAIQLNYYNTKRIHSSLRTNPAAYAAGFEQCEKEKQQLTQQVTIEVRDKVMTVSGT